MHAEIDEKQRTIDLLKAEFEKRQWELDDLQNVLREALAESKDLDGMIEERDATIAELEAILWDGKGGRLKEVTQERFVPTSGDDVDALLNEYLKLSKCDVPIKKLGGGYYIFGTKKIYAKIMNGKLVIWVGGGYMVIDEFIQAYGESEK